jgi:hypothetical protein
MPAFSPLSPARAQDFPRTLAGFTSERVTWGTPPEFRAWVCLTHELTHYLQDLSSGVGHWDHMARNRQFTPLLERARFHSNGLASLPVRSAEPIGNGIRHLEDETLEHVRRLRSQLLVVLGDAGSAERRSAFAELATPLLRAGASVDAFRIDSLLEGEAAAVSLRQVISIEVATAEQWAIVKDNASVWLPSAMPAEYGDLLNDVIELMKHLYGAGADELEGQELDAFLLMSARLMCLLVDISCAHPSVDLLAAKRADFREYEPGLRCLRMLAAIGAMDERQFGEAFKAMQEDAERFESLLIEVGGYRYLPSRAVYADWADWFDKLVANDPNDWIAQLRADCCRIRVEHPDAFADKSLWSLLDNKLPFFVLGPDGLTSMGQQWAHLDPEAIVQIKDELMVNAVRLGIHDLFFETGRFVCPYALAQTCDGATVMCGRGLQRTSQFPAASVCEVRETLELNGFTLGGEP